MENDSTKTDKKRKTSEHSSYDSNTFTIHDVKDCSIDFLLNHMSICSSYHALLIQEIQDLMKLEPLVKFAADIEDYVNLLQVSTQRSMDKRYLPMVQKLVDDTGLSYESAIVTAIPIRLKKVVKLIRDKQRNKREAIALYLFSGAFEGKAMKLEYISMMNSDSLFTLHEYVTKSTASMEDKMIAVALLDLSFDLVRLGLYLGNPIFIDTRLDQIGKFLGVNVKKVTE